MPQYDDKRLVDLVNRLEQEDPKFARSLSEGRPTRPREYRHTRAWILLALGLGMLTAGLVLPDGLLIATGLVVSGIAAQFFDPDRQHHRRPGGCSAH